VYPTQILAAVALNHYRLVQSKRVLVVRPLEKVTTDALEANFDGLRH
jgi:hypothetical protein